MNMPAGVTASMNPAGQSESDMITISAAPTRTLRPPRTYHEMETRQAKLPEPQRKNIQMARADEHGRRRQRGHNEV